MNQKVENIQTHLKTDDCHKKYQYIDNKSIFDYVTNTNMFINKNACFDITPPFLSFLPIGKPQQNIDIENELFNINRNNSRCPENKWISNNPNLAEIVSNIPDTTNINANLCIGPKQQIRFDGYYPESNILRQKSNGPLS